jgi:hypothetical protein
VAPWQPPGHWDEIQSQLFKSGQVTLNSVGKGYISFDPENARQRWEVTQVVVTTNQSSTATIVPVATVGKNVTDVSTASPGLLGSATWSGNQDTWQGEMLISSGDYLAVLFAPPAGQSGASLAGVVCTAQVTGVKYTRRA